MKSDFSKAVKKAVSEKEAAVTIAREAMYWLAQENLTLHKSRVERKTMVTQTYF